MRIHKHDVKVYSQKAYQILKSLIIDGCYNTDKANAHVIRDETGEVVMEMEYPYGEVEYAWNTAAQILLSRYKKPGERMTISVKAEDERVMMVKDLRFPVKEIYLLGYILSGTPRPKLEKYFGKEAVDEMIGKPCNPLEMAKRTLPKAEIEKLREQESKEIDQVLKDFNATGLDPLTAAGRREWEKYNDKKMAIMRKFEAEIGKIRAELETK